MGLEGSALRWGRFVPLDGRSGSHFLHDHFGSHRAVHSDTPLRRIALDLWIDSAADIRAGSGPKPHRCGRAPCSDPCPYAPSPDNVPVAHRFARGACREGNPSLRVRVGHASHGRGRDDHPPWSLLWRNCDAPREAATPWPFWQHVSSWLLFPSQHPETSAPRFHRQPPMLDSAPVETALSSSGSARRASPPDA